MAINKSTAKKLQYRWVFWPGNIKSTGTVNRYFRVGPMTEKLRTIDAFKSKQKAKSDI